MVRAPCHHATPPWMAERTPPLTHSHTHTHTLLRPPAHPYAHSTHTVPPALLRPPLHRFTVAEAVVLVRPRSLSPASAITTPEAALLTRLASPRLDSPHLAPPRLASPRLAPLSGAVAHLRPAMHRAGGGEPLANPLPEELLRDQTSRLGSLPQVCRQTISAQSAECTVHRNVPPRV